MNQILLHIIAFIIARVVIVGTGFRLSNYGDLMTEMTGWGKSFMETILMAFIDVGGICVNDGLAIL